MMAMAEWQRGIELARLKGIAALFAERQKALVFGAFGLTKERDIAAALSAQQLAWTGDEDQPAAAAICHRLKVAGGVTDFAQRHIDIPAGHVKISAFAARDIGSGTAVLGSLANRFPQRLWVEVFEEDDIARAVLEELPELRYRATRIAAGSELKGIYSNAAGMDAALHPAEGAALVEIEPYAEWEQHYSSYNKRHSWTAYALRGFDPEDPRFIMKPSEMSRAWKAEHPARMNAAAEWTKACPNFPHTMRTIQRIIGNRGADRVRLMKLAPNGELSRHADITDREAGLANGRLARLHLPIRTSEGVIFHGWDKRGRHIVTRFREGALCYLDQRGPHRVENRDPNCDRIHLVIDVESDASLRDRIGAAM